MERALSHSSFFHYLYKHVHRLLFVSVLESLSASVTDLRCVFVLE